MKNRERSMDIFAGGLLLAAVIVIGLLMCPSGASAHSDDPDTQAEHLSTKCTNSYWNGCWECSHYTTSYDVSTETQTNNREGDRLTNDVWCDSSASSLSGSYTCEPVRTTDSGHTQFKALVKTIYASIETAKTGCGYHTNVGAHRHISVPGD